MKKSETLEIRLTHESKQALMSKAADKGRSASDVVRGFVGEDVSGEFRPSYMATHWLIALSLIAVAPAAVLATNRGQASTGTPAPSDAEQARDLERFLATWTSYPFRAEDIKALRTL
jgi:hypothetical protein